MEAELKQMIQQCMADASTAVFETGSVNWKRSKDGSGIDVAKLLLDQPDLQRRYRSLSGKAIGSGSGRLQVVFISTKRPSAAELSKPSMISRQ